MVIDALRAAGAVETVVAVSEVEAPFERILAAGADGIAVPLRALTSRQWEQLAGAVEAGKRLWAGALDVADPAATLPRVATSWKTCGAHGGSWVFPRPRWGRCGSRRRRAWRGTHRPTATAVLTRLTQVADGLNQLALG